MVSYQAKKRSGAKTVMYKRNPLNQRGFELFTPEENKIKRCCSRRRK
jgi:hypothetical protein